MSHPLDPVTVDELSAAVALFGAAGRLSERAFFSAGWAVEPSRADLARHDAGEPLDRIIRLIGHDREQRQSFEADVSVTGGELTSFRWIDEGQAAISFDDVVHVVLGLGEHPEWVAALQARGVTDLEKVHIEPWLAGINPPQMPTGRVLRAIAFLHEHPEDNYYARPVEGLTAYIDVDNGEVIVEDHGVVPTPTESGDYAAQFVENFRDDIKPLDIIQPGGPSFEVHGSVITWQKWHMRVSVNPVEGMVLHDVRYRDGDEDRKIFHRMALSDMVVPYGDASPLHYWKHAFDAGETCLGHQVNSLKLGCDCLGEIVYLDAVFLNSEGEPYVAENAICTHEEDFGILWKHTNVFQPELPPEVRRSRRFVVSTICTVGNYEYGFFWYFYQDGTIQLEVKLTGIIGVSALHDGTDLETSPQVGPNVTSPIHQHLFCVRLDPALDGGTNSVVETNVVLDVDGAHPYGAGFRAVGTTLETEKQAMRVIDPAASRTWKMINPNSLNSMGNPVGYKIVLHRRRPLLPPEDSPAGRRGGFARNNLWVTKYDDQQHYAGAGPFTHLHPGNGVGLPSYVAEDRSVTDTDIVVWHTFGVTHVPRPEDWPVMPVEYVGFTMMPVGFFDQNPALDVPPSAGSACHSEEPG
nr:LOW QUALITY PROTEIN: histamine oxidase-like [Nerophis lumbriciformis]